MVQTERGKPCQRCSGSFSDSEEPGVKPILPILHGIRSRYLAKPDQGRISGRFLISRLVLSSSILVVNFGSAILVVSSCQLLLSSAILVVSSCQLLLSSAILVVSSCQLLLSIAISVVQTEYNHILSLILVVMPSC